MNKEIIFMIHLNMEIDYHAFPLNLHSIKAYTKNSDTIKKQYDIQVHTLNYDFGGKRQTKRHTSKLLSTIGHRQPSIICLSCFMYNVEEMAELVHDIKTLYPNIIIILEGPEVNKDLMEYYQYAHIGILRYTEYTFTQIIENIKTLKNIPNIIYKEKKSFIETANVSPKQIMEKLSNPYQNIDKKEIPKKIRIEISRKEKNKKEEYLSKKQLENVFTSLKHSNINSIYLDCEDIFAKEEKFEEIIELISKYLDNDIEIYTKGNPQNITDNTIKIIKNSNIKEIEINIEGFDKNILKTFGKTINKNDFINGIKKLRNTKISCNIQTTAGLPKDNFFKHALFISALNQLQEKNICIKDRIATISNSMPLRENMNELGIKRLEAPYYTCIQTCSQKVGDIIKTNLWANNMNKEEKLYACSDFEHRK